MFAPDEPGAAIGILAPGGFRYAKGVGLANLEQGIVFSPQTTFRACSITKQFVCLLVRQLEQEGEINLDAHPSRYVPALTAFPATLTVRHLCQNRSGLLDYWCAAMLTGAKAESRFTLEQGAALIQSLNQPMFEPGAQYSYNNGNWRILEWILESVTGKNLSELLSERIFVPLGMSHSYLGSDTSIALPGGSKGYWQPGGWHQEITRACWSGDAALVTTLDDLLLWEAAMLKPNTGTLPCSDGLDQALPNPDGSPGCYAFGINVWQQDGRWMQWHGGALRGWRMTHFRFPQDGVAIVVMMNRTGNPTPHALALAEELGIKPTWDALVENSPDPHPAVGGVFHCSRLGLVAEVSSMDDEVMLELGGEAVALLWIGPTMLASANGFFRVEVIGNALRIHARHFGWKEDFELVEFRDDRARLSTRKFHNDALKSTISFSQDGNELSITGPLGTSDTYSLRPLAKNLVAFDCKRALDELPPGRFTMRLSDDARQLELSCFLARKIRFDTIAG
ncbi:MAG: serine hydrolase [Betaproteobacteria bacterium]|nr:serine hydrolase [Betaproteobacteria bacterium]